MTWTAPTDTGGAPITGYTVQAFAGTSTTPAATLTAAGDATSLAVPGLTNGTGYTFTVAATNAVGTGAFSARSRPSPRRPYPRHRPSECRPAATPRPP